MNYTEMSRVSLSELKFEPTMEDLFWKQKTWTSLENETDIKVLKDAIYYLLELFVQKQSIIKSLIQYQLKQDLQSFKEEMSSLLSDPDPELDLPLDQSNPDD